MVFLIFLLFFFSFFSFSSSFSNKFSLFFGCKIVAISNKDRRSRGVGQPEKLKPNDQRNDFDAMI